MTRDDHGSTTEHDAGRWEAMRGQAEHVDERPSRAEAEMDECRPVEVDGEIIRVHGSGEMDDTDRAHVAELVRAARRRFEAEQLITDIFTGTYDDDEPDPS